MSPMFRSSLVAAAALFFLQLSSVQAANVLFVSDSTTDANLPGVLSADGHNVTVVNSDYSGGANATLTASLSSYDLVVWSATGGGYGGSHNAATITALESFVSGGGKVFLTGYDSLASPTDSNLIGFVGGGTVSDGGSPASAVVNQVNSLSVGVVDIRGVTPSGGYSDQDTVRNLQSGVVGVVASSSSNGYVWVLRSLGNGEIAYVSNGAHRSTSVTPSWTNTASGGAGAYNAAVRNFASSVTDNDGDGATLSEDCDDNDPNNFPGNPEVCDGADNDCDATTFAVGGESDADADGSIACLDCDDNDPNNYPGNTELCDGADNDCDGSLLGGVASAPQSLTTTFAAGNGSQGNIFDVVVQNDVQVTGFDAHVTSSGSGTMDVWWKLGTGYNSTSSNTDWTFHETVSIAGVGSTGTPTPVPLSTPISLSGGQTYSIYMLSSNGIRYTSGSTLGAVVAQDGNIEVTEGYGCGSAFTCTFNPRIWNGTIHYFESGSLEADDDGDGYVDCTWVGSDPAIVGGDDCDDGNTTAWPGSTELCDGIDNDCDGTPDFIGPGYYGVADSGSGGPAFNFVDIEATGTSLSLGDDQVSPAVAIGFSFDFYGVPYSQAYVSSNGFVTFDANSNSGCCSGQSLPSTTAPNNLIAMLWEDLRPPSGGSIHYETQGTSPNGLFIVQFTDIEHYFSGNPSTMQLQLHEDGRIEIHYLSVQSDGGNHTIGIENGDGTLASTYVNRADPGAITNLAVGFPTPAGSTEVDSDGDSSLACADCDDNEASVFPGNPEVCDGLDNDCDATTEASGGEGDGDGDGAVACADCDDAVATNFPGNTEACDGLDNDCDATTFAVGGEIDADADSVISCADCDDNEATVFPGNAEICDGLDNDCDAATEASGGEGDSDGDGAVACADCDDAVASNFPGNAEICDGLDNDCDSTTEAAGGESDGDGDGSIACDDCDDADAASYPGNAEICDGLDNDCNGFNDAGASYELDATTFDFTDISATGTALSLDDDDVSSAQQIGFAFPFFGVGYSEFYVSSNGFVTFTDTTNSGCCSGDTLPSVSGPNNIVAMWWADLDPSEQGEIYVETVGTSPNQVAIVQFDNVTHYADGSDGTPDSNTFQLKMFEADGALELHFDAVGPDLYGEVHTVGVENVDGTLAVTYLNAANPLAEVGTAQRFSTIGGETDNDGDGYPGCDDCDDGDSGVFPGNTELCDGVDNDCDPTTAPSGGDADADGDGFLGCDECDDDPVTGVNAYPGNTEICDGLDNDCDSSTEAAGGEGDADGDGSAACEDCDDAVASNFPGNPEVCDGLDNDCDPATEAAGGEGDADGDGSPVCIDCDDSDGSNFPGNVEICDTVDNDCDATTDETLDGDSDGQTPCDGDCDDLDELIFAGADEICDNGVDNDCDATTDETVDGDGDGDAICDGDCDDADAEIGPQADELCDDGVDNDCDGDIDDIDTDCGGTGDDDDTTGDDDDTTGDDDSAGDDDDDDDDSAGDDDDDDDSSGDGDDDDSSALIDDLIIGCNCVNSMADGSPSTALWLLLGLLGAAVPLRRRR